LISAISIPRAAIAAFAHDTTALTALLTASMAALYAAFNAS